MVNTIPREEQRQTAKYRAVRNAIEGRVVEGPEDGRSARSPGDVTIQQVADGAQPDNPSSEDDVSPRVEPTADYGRDRSEGRDRVRD